MENPEETQKQEPEVKEEVKEVEDLFVEPVAGDGEPEPEIDAEDSKVINGVVDKRLTPIQKELMETRTEMQLDKLLNGPDGDVYAPHIDKIRKYAFDPRLSGLSLKAKADLAVGPNAWRQRGAAEERKAREEAAFSRGIGAGARPQAQSQVPDFTKMSRQEFADYQEKIIAGRA